MTDEDNTRKSKSEDIAMKVKSVDEKDNSATTSSDRAPTPPQRDYDAEANGAAAATENKRKKLGSFPTRPVFVYKPDHTETWMSCLRSCLIITNLLIWLFGAIITALGVWIKVDDDFLSIQTNLDLKQFTEASYVLIVAGVVIMLVGFMGCYGVIASQMCILICFSVIVLVVLLLEIAVMVMVWTAVSNKNAQEQIKLKATTAMHEMHDHPAKVYFVDLLQSKLKCCGVSGPGDYSSDENNPKPIPDSCTNHETGMPYEIGCYESVVNYLKSKAAIIGGVAVAIFLLQLAVLVFTTCFICSIKNAATNSIF